jgi:hypothetical protein
MKESGSRASTGEIYFIDEAVETPPRPSNRGVGAMLFLITFAILAFGIEILWLGFLTWLLIRGLF